MRVRSEKGALAVALFGAVTLAACDFEVVNPGPVQDVNVNLPGAHRSLVNGAIDNVQEAIGVAYVGENITHALVPNGHTGTGGTSNEEEMAVLTNESNGDNGTFNSAQEGRWVAEEAIRRFTSEEGGVEDPSSYPLLMEAYLWAGLGNRVLGENMCTTVVDGGPAEPKLKHFEYAIPHFTAAEEMAQRLGDDDVMYAAIGARAAAHLFLGNGAAARADALKVPFDFQFQTSYPGADANNYIYGTVLSFAFQSGSMWGTPAHTHFLTTGDSRVAWGYDNGSLPPYPTGETVAVRGQTHPSRQTWVGLVPMYYPLKGYAPRVHGTELRYFVPNLDDQRLLQTNLVTGREMALIIAETYLMEGNFQTAMNYINQVRTSTPVYAANLATEMNLALHPAEAADKARTGMPDYFTGTPGDFSAGGFLQPVTANSLEEAWAALKFERYLEMTLESRRFGDRWRWRANNTPGALHPLEYLPQETAGPFGVPTDPLNLCFPLPKSENDANNSIDETYQDWVDRP
jgi:hypothetical protein